MLRDENTVAGRDVSSLPLARAKRPARRKAPVTLFDPYSQQPQQMIVHTNPGDAMMARDLSPASGPGGDAAGGTSKALLLLQLTLLSMVGVMVWYMLSLLQVT